ncbi:Digestive cysteine proteinase 3-like 5 [Homarus americanus]|uniref:Digestive cysteine proteinase 3-like 5 n=1 Tax=Homarus americanus TaxID=6706 RepID=A0A8J5TLL0_HOMAM|nr:Digestive cysteine proteinase 3-like 5 [Homarus americanus]
MKVAALLLCVAGLTAATETLTSWKLFKARYGRQYESLVEENYRYGIFKKNEERVNNHNLKHERGEVTFTMAMNQFGDMTNEEFNTKMKGYQRQPHLEHVSVLAAGEYLPRTTDLDWREKGAVTPVKNQLQCGSCWAFSTTGSLEGQHFIKKGKLVSLSEQQLVDCSGDYGNFGCGGGNMDSAFQYIKDNKGIDTECSYSYEAKNGHCRFNKTSVAATVTGYVNLEQDNETALLIAVSEVGPISVAIDASHPSFQLCVL